MSIPPLVCSTPPPPDQCEDDKDPGDFDLSYSLSQEEDDDDENNVYNYGNFSSYNNFQPMPDNKPLEIQEITKNDNNETQKEVILAYDSEKKSESIKVVHNVFETNDINENKLKCDEDMNIEDLNLKVDEEIESIIESNSIQVDTSEPNIVIVKNFDIPSSSNNDSPICDNVSLSAFDDNPIDTTDPLKELNSNVDNNLQDISCENDSDKTQKLEEIEITSNPNLQGFNEHKNLTETKPDENIINDDFSDFGDFDDFQSVNSKNNVSSVVEKSENPWVNDDSNQFEFGNFAVNFEDKFSTEDNVTSKSESVSNNEAQLKSEVKETDHQLEDDDDFGDFDDFKSSARKPEANEIGVEDPSHCHHELSVLNLQSTENEPQILESITNVLRSVFLEEITEPENEFEGKLESLLSETWGHLMETDERQPYIVHWNNSLGQKTLLKALCIDSRNILFGPKWSSNMPKYAVNLSNAPLQPQKQASDSSSTLTQNEIVAEKPVSKPTTWTDSFTSEGQESCNTENDSSTITSNPADLDVFESSAAPKSDKIFSNTIGIQPLRQINLPDTHIFTPTDSEVPRSKTIHYDSTPTVLIPQIASDMKSEKHTTNNTTTLENNADDNEYWDFQNFKSSSDKSEQVSPPENNFQTAKIVNALPKPNMAYQTELLQPIKVESTMPTLNWPDPGEVKEVFDDFSDFVSSSQSTTDKQDTHSTVMEPRLEPVDINKLDCFRDYKDKTAVVSEFANPNTNTLDDDFATFQSAQPSKSTNNVFKETFPDNPNNQLPTSHITEFDNASPKLYSTKSEIISFGNTSKPTEALTKNISFTPYKEQSNKSSLSLNNQMQTNLLQPTPASSNAVNLQNQQKSTQILQPLSLESYSQINWPSPGMDLQDLSRFNPVETLHSLKSDLSVSGLNKAASPIHTAKSTVVNQGTDDDGWGEFVSSKPNQQQAQPKKPSVFVDDDEWTDFISSPSVKPVNGLNTISLNVHTNSNIQKSVQNKYAKKGNQPPLDIPTLNYITPKSNPHMSYNDKHFQNL